jgi:hypothetical protein
MIRTGPGRMTRLFFLMMPPVPMIVTGTIGTLARTANKLLPFLKGPMVPSSDRVPSGKITTEFPCLIFSTVATKDWYAFLLLLRSTLMYPAAFIDQPTNGILNKPAFATQRICTGR